jgi:phage shock protein PspC (stress-responsive transcriptional regulator)
LGAGVVAGLDEWFGWESQLFYPLMVVAIAIGFGIGYGIQWFSSSRRRRGIAKPS